MSPTERYQRIAQIVDEAYTEYENGLIALRRRAVDDMKRKLKEGVLDRSQLGASLPRKRPASAAQRPRPRGPRE
jgi:hypothetical protein